MMRLSARVFAALVVLSLLPASLQAQVNPDYVVTTTDDNATPTLGMLRWAITKRNACSAGCPSITFNIPDTDLRCTAPAAPAPGFCTIPLAAPLPTLSSGVIPYIIDGSSQGLFNGYEVVINGNGVVGDGLTAGSRVSLISFNIGGFSTGAAVRLTATADDSSISGLDIGYNPTQTALPNQVGILVDSGYSGGYTGSIMAAIHNSAQDAIRLGTAPGDTTIRGVRLTALSLKNNGSAAGDLGIDLGNDGVTPNDADLTDNDTGVNSLLNFPVLTGASETLVANEVRVTGSFVVDDPWNEYDLEIYQASTTSPVAYSYLGVFHYIGNGSTTTFTFDELASGWDPAAGAVAATVSRRDNSMGVHETSELSPTKLVARSDLELTKSGPASSVAGRSMSWTLGVKNLSPDYPASTVTVTDPLPAGATYVSAAGTGWSCSFVSPNVGCTAASLAPSYNDVITITAIAPVGPATITNTATISAASGNRVATNDSATFTTTLVYSDMTVSKNASPASVPPGGSVTFNITATNSGSAGADGVQVVDSFPAGFTFVSQSGAGWDPCSPSGSTVICNRSSLAGELPAGVSSGLSLVFTAASTPNTYTNNVSVSSSNEANGANNTASANVVVSASADLAISIVDDPDPVATSDTSHYFATITNNGPSPATNVTLTATIPAGMTYFTSFPTCTVVGSTLTCPLGTLASGFSVEQSIYLFAPSAAGNVTFTGSVSATEADPNSANNAFAEATGVVARLNFTVNSTADRVDAAPGDGICQSSSPGECTLRAAIQEANAYPGPGNVIVPSGTYTLTLAGTNEDNAATGDLDVTETLWLYGSPGTVINGGGIDRVFHVLPRMYGPIPAGGGAPLVTRAIPSRPATRGIQAMGATGSPVEMVSANATAAAMTAYGFLWIEDVTISGGNAGAADGGGIFVAGRVYLVNSILENNSAANGGGLFGGPDSNFEILESTVRGNAASSNGGGVFSSSNWSDLNAVDASTLSGNSAAVSGGALYYGAVDPLEVTDSTFSGNSAVSGGGIYYGGTSLLIKSSTLASNAGTTTGGAILNSSGSGLTIVNSILAASTSGGDCGGISFTGNNDLFGDATCVAAGSGNLASTNPMLGPLQNNGGFTDTHALLPGSPAIDAGSGCDLFDQRLFSRPVDGNADGIAACDIGAFELLPLANLSVTKSVSQTNVPFGTQFSFTIVVTNAGPSAASSVVVTDSLPAGASFVSATSTSGSCVSGVTCSVGTLAANASATITITVTGSATGNWMNQATVSAAESDPDTANNASAVSFTVIPASDLSVVKTGPASVAPGSAFSYTLMVTNAGPHIAPVRITDTLPAGVSFVSASVAGTSGSLSCSTSGSTVLCDLISLGVETATVTLNVNAPATAGTIVNTASVSTTNYDGVSTNNQSSASTTIVETGADVSLNKRAPSTVDIGARFEYDLTVQNGGPAAATNVVVTDDLPSGVDFVSASGTGWSCSAVRGVVTCSRASLTAGGSSTITLRVDAPGSTGRITNQASVTATEADPVASNNVDRASTTVVNPCATVGPALNAPANGAEVTTPVAFSWDAVTNAARYRLTVSSATAVVAEQVLTAPAVSATAALDPGSYSWTVAAEFDNGCTTVTSAARTMTVVLPCPTAAPQPLEPLAGAPLEFSPVEFRWSAVDGAERYELFLSINGGAFELAGTAPGAATEPSLSVAIPAGATVAWYVEAVPREGCSRTRSGTVEVNVSCYSPVLSLQGEVTTGKPYQVRASIVSVGRRYLFEESDTPEFARVLAEKEGEVDPTGEFVFTDFEHEVAAPTPFYYRTRLAQQGCASSDVGRIVVIPLPSPTAAKTETVVQLGNEEVIRQTLFVPSPTPDQQISYTFVAATDREWMQVEPAAGTIGPEGVTLTVITNPVGLAVGTNTGTVTLTFTAVAGGKRALDGTPATSKPVSVTLVTPVTNKGKESPQSDSLIIPAVAHATGVNSEWQSDLRLLNLGGEKTKYALNLTVSGQDGTVSGKTSEIELAAGQNTALNDVVKQWYGLGSLPGEGATGVLEIRPLGPAGPGKGAHAIPVTRTLVSLASSRTYNRTANGTLGEYIPAIPFASFVGGSTPAEGKKSVLSLQQLAQSTAYRTNLGVVEASGEPVGVEIRVYDAEGVKLLTVPLTLQAGEHRQLNQVLATNGLTDVASARAEVEVVSGEGRIAAYASVVDNVTGDPLQVAAVDLAKIGARRYVMPGVAHFDTGLARWRTDVQMFNAGIASVSATLDFYPVGATAPSRTATVEIGPGKIRTLADIVPTVFGESNTGGAIQVSTATNSELVISGRTYDQREEGSYGQFMAAVTEDDAIGLGDRAIQVLQMEESRDLRSNLGIVEVSGKEVRVEVMAFPAESRVTPRAEFTLKPNEFRQFNAVLKSLNAGTTYNARVALRVIGGDGKIVAYGSAVDNLTQDPTYIPGQ